MSSPKNVYKFVRNKQQKMSRRNFLKTSAATVGGFSLAGKVAVDRIPNVNKGESQIIVPDGFGIAANIDIHRGDGMLITDVILTNNADRTVKRLDYTYTLRGSGVTDATINGSVPNSFIPDTKGEVSFAIDISDRVEAVLNDGLHSFKLEIEAVFEGED